MLYERLCAVAHHAEVDETHESRTGPGSQNRHLRRGERVKTPFHRKPQYKVAEGTYGTQVGGWRMRIFFHTSGGFTPEATSLYKKVGALILGPDHGHRDH